MEKREHNFKSFANEHNNKIVAFRAKVVICLFLGSKKHIPQLRSKIFIYFISYLNISL